MFRRKNANTKVGNVESTYGVELNARGDAKLGNLLRKRGFDSQSQLIRAARGQLTEPARVGSYFSAFIMKIGTKSTGFV